MGIPSPGETALVLAAVLASQGKLQIWLVIVIGDRARRSSGTTSATGSGAGSAARCSRPRGRCTATGAGLSAAAIGSSTSHGAKAVFLGRWIALVRFATAWLAGINEMRFAQFFVWNALGAITWGLTYGLVGYYGGNAAAHVLSQVGIAGAVVLAVCVVGFIVYLRVHREPGAEDHGAASDRQRDEQ